MANNGKLSRELTTLNTHYKKSPFIFGKSWFLVDLYQTSQVVTKYKSEIAIDSSIENIVLKKIRQDIHLPEIYSHTNVLESLNILSQDTLLNKLKSRPNLVWVTLATSISGCIFYSNENISKAIDGRLIGIVSASAFNCGYSGIKLYIWDHDYFQQTKKPPQPLSHFYGGLSLCNKNNWSLI